MSDKEQMLQMTIGELKIRGYGVLLTDEQTEKAISVIVADLGLAPALEPIARIVVRTFLDGLRAISLANDMLKGARKGGAELGLLLTPRDKS